MNLGILPRNQGGFIQYNLYSKQFKIYYSTIVLLYNILKKHSLYLKYTRDSFESSSIPDTDKYDVLIIESKTKTGICFVSFNFGQIQITSNLVRVIKRLQNFDKT